MYQCNGCNRRFDDLIDVRMHMNEYGHWNPQYECHTCTRQFMTQQAREQHMNNVGHWPSFECDTCTADFPSQKACDQHMAAKGHWSNYCAPCDRRFDSANNLKMHLNSKTHRGSDFNCPCCKRAFTTASGVSTHLETNSCPNAQNLNRETIWRMIRQRDPGNLVTTKMLTWNNETDGATFTSTDRAWNGSAWECYLCHRTFGQKTSLNAHLSSPAHKSNLYHCPNRSCGSQFKTLASVFGHLESESCQFMRFEQVQNHAKKILTSNRALTFY